MIATRLKRTRSRRVRRCSRRVKSPWCLSGGMTLLPVKHSNSVKRSKTSAGLLMFRKKESGLEVLLVHPGGPFFRNKESGAWTIPKGEAAEGEDLRLRARLEFEEELGVEPPASEWTELGMVKQNGGKRVHAWACEGDLPEGF